MRLLDEPEGKKLDRPIDDSGTDDVDVSDDDDDDDGADDESDDDEDASAEDDDAEGSADDDSEETDDDDASASASESTLNLALAEDGRVACPLLPFLYLDGFKSVSKFVNTHRPGHEGDDIRKDGDGKHEMVPSELLHEKLRSDCARAFTARATSKKTGPYSSGRTYWLGAMDTPKCGLEEIARTVFELHTQRAVEAFAQAKLKTSDAARCCGASKKEENQSEELPFDPTNSGAEWWTQVVSVEDEIGMHWDKDYALENSDLNVHPQIATVTYLCSKGAPTLFVRKRFVVRRVSV